MGVDSVAAPSNATRHWTLTPATITLLLSVPDAVMRPPSPSSPQPEAPEATRVAYRRAADTLHIAW